jgi:SAM-dependent methyltransferase
MEFPDLDELATRYDASSPTSSYDYWLKRFAADAILEYWRGGDLLELGCATGELSALLAPYVAGAHVIVEGAAANVQRTRERVPSAYYVLERFERFDPTLTPCTPAPAPRQFDDIVCAGVLEHVDDPLELLERARGWLRPGGRLHVVVPNGRSLHRWVGYHLGAISSLSAIEEPDIAQGHRRHYSWGMLENELALSRWRMLHRRGLGLKSLPGPAMLDWSEELVSAHHLVGSSMLVEYCAELYTCATTGAG